ncbi:hypothetical protein N7470_007233 [Penicillium chermesinum]|nr:hypothetical protein N7470_007233 [Penicillium chermesinum]
MRKLDIQELTIAQFHSALREKTTTCVDLVRTYLSRIAQFDPELNSIICLNDEALQIAAVKDRETKHLIQTMAPFRPLHGVPIILKDNYMTKGLPTSAGVKALRALQSANNSQVVSHLTSAGAIILAKANLHEFALHGTTTSSLGGQTLNPYDFQRTPGGSSGGTAAALAANFGLVGCGTDTMNSLRSPASACGIVGFRPSTGKVPTQGIVPVSRTQDVAGPMGRTVNDVKIVYYAMRVRNPRIGILDLYFGIGNPQSCSPGTIAENGVIQNITRGAISLIQKYTNIGFVAIKPDQSWEVDTLLETADTQPYEFGSQLNEFLQAPFIASSPHTSLESIFESGEYHKGAVTEVFTASRDNPRVFSPNSPEYHARLAAISKLKFSLERCFKEYDVDAFLYPHQRQLPVAIGAMRQPRRNGVLAALTGSPAICLPAGFTEATQSATLGVPVGIELMGRRGRDAELLELAEMIEKVLPHRKPPLLTIRKSL